MQTINFYQLIENNHPDGIIRSRKGCTTMYEPFRSEGLGTLLAMLLFRYKWEIPVWLRFTEDVVWDFSGFDYIAPTASEMVVDTILFHENKGIKIYVKNLKDELYFAKANNILISEIKDSDNSDGMLR